MKFRVDQRVFFFVVKSAKEDPKFTAPVYSVPRDNDKEYYRVGHYTGHIKIWSNMSHDTYPVPAKR